MKKMIAGLLCATLIAPLAAPAMAAPDRHEDRRDGRPDVKRAAVKKTVTYKSFRKGQHFDRRYARNYQVVDYHRYGKRLKAPPRGYRYVRSGHDVLLVGATNGIVAAVVSGVFR